MRITLCGSARFEKEFKDYNKRLTLAGHVVYSLAVYPSDESGKSWYTEEQKKILDEIHLRKIDNSDAVYVIAPGGYVGDSTRREITYTLLNKKMVMCAYPLSIDGVHRTCPFNGCSDVTMIPPCALCYE